MKWINHMSYSANDRNPRKACLLSAVAVALVVVVVLTLTLSWNTLLMKLFLLLWLLILAAVIVENNKKEDEEEGVAASDELEDIDSVIAFNDELIAFWIACRYMFFIVWVICLWLPFSLLFYFFLFLIVFTISIIRARRILLTPQWRVRKLLPKRICTKVRCFNLYLN